MSGGELRDLDDLGVLDEVASARRQADRQEARLLAAVVAYVDLHPVVDPDDAAGWPAGGTPPGQRPQRAPLAGPGTPLVAEYAVEALGAVLHQPYRTTLSLVADAVELCFRLPRLWALVHDGSLQALKARQVAHETTHLSEAAVGFVDRHLAVTAARNQVPRNLSGLIHEALDRCDPKAAAGREQAALDRRDVTVQTSPANLAALCRRHHRLKTFTAWTYTRTTAGAYRWTSPHRRTYLVTPKR